MIPHLKPLIARSALLAVLGLTITFAGGPLLSAQASGPRPLAAAVALEPPAASVAVTPTVAAPGTEVTESETGYTAWETVNIVVSGLGNPLTTAVAGADGVVPATRVVLPYTLAAGGHTLTLTGASSYRSASTPLTLSTVVATLVVSPTSIMQGSTVTLTGANWAPQEPVSITLDGAAAPLTVAKANADGTLPATALTIPYSWTASQHTFAATGAVSTRLATAPVTVGATSASLSVTPAATNHGGLVTVQGSNFAPAEAVTLTIDGVITPLAVQTTNAQGVLPLTGLSIPYGIAAGAHVLSARGSVSQRTASASITVVALTPSLVLSAATAGPGTAVTVTGNGFGRQEQVTLALNGEALATSPGVISAYNGAFTALVVLPPSLLHGANTISAIGADSRVSAVATLSGVGPVARTLYFAGAATTAGEQPTLAVLNPGAQAAHVELAFYYVENTVAPGHASVDVAAHTRATIDLRPLAGPERTFGLKLEADRTVSAQLQVARAGKDGFALMGVPAPQTTWYLAEGYTGLTFRETIVLLNPEQRAVHVQLRLLPSPDTQLRRSRSPWRPRAPSWSTSMS